MRAYDKSTVINPTSSRVNIPCLEMSGKTNAVRQTHPATNDLHSPTIILEEEEKRLRRREEKMSDSCANRT